MNTENHSQTTASVTDPVRGDLKQSQYGRIILPVMPLRRLECVLEPTRQVVLKEAKSHKNESNTAREQLLQGAFELLFLNTSRVTLAKLAHTRQHPITKKAVSRGPLHA